MSQRADLIVTNAAVYTCDPEREWAEAFAVSGGDVIAVGSADEIGRLSGPDTRGFPKESDGVCEAGPDLRILGHCV